MSVIYHVYVCGGGGGGLRFKPFRSLSAPYLLDIRTADLAHPTTGVNAPFVVGHKLQRYLKKTQTAPAAVIYLVFCGVRKENYNSHGGTIMPSMHMCTCVSIQTTYLCVHKEDPVPLIGRNGRGRNRSCLLNYSRAYLPPTKHPINRTALARVGLISPTDLIHEFYFRGVLIIQ